jgi:uncharacterized protein (PEP-CTERM system associated)
MKYRHAIYSFLILSINSIAFAEQKIEKKISMQHFYSDNLELLPRDIKKSENITEIYPQLLYIQNQKQRHLEGLYAFQGIHYWSETRDDKIYQRGYFRLQTPKNPKRFEFEGYARVTQEVLFPESSLSNNIFNSQNSDVFSFLLKPTAAHNFGPSYKAKYSVTYGQVHYLNEPVPSNSDLRIRAQIVPQKKSNNFEISGFAEKRWTYIDAASDIHDEHIGISTRYKFTPKVNILFEGGYDKYHQSEDTNRVDGIKLLGGFQWALSRLTNVKVLLGKQSHGSSGEFFATTRTRNHVFQAHYQELIENSARQSLRLLPEVNPQNLTKRSTEFNPTTDNGLFIARLNEINWNGLIGTFQTNASLFYNRHQLIDSQQNQTDYGVNAGLQKRITNSISTSLNGGYAQHRFYDTQRDRRTFGGINLSKLVAKNTNISVYANKFLTKSSFLYISTQENSIGARLIYQET